MKKYYYVIKDEQTKVFRTDAEAYSYDFKHNPEMHPTKDLSFKRYEEAIFPVTARELTRAQQLELEKLLNE